MNERRSKEARRTERALRLRLDDRMREAHQALSGTLFRLELSRRCRQAHVEPHQRPGEVAALTRALLGESGIDMTGIEVLAFWEPVAQAIPGWGSIVFRLQPMPGGGDSENTRIRHRNVAV